MTNINLFSVITELRKLEDANKLSGTSFNDEVASFLAKIPRMCDNLADWQNEVEQLEHQEAREHQEAYVYELNQAIEEVRESA